MVINGKEIYWLQKNKPVVIPVTKNHPQIIATDGFHFTKPVYVEFRRSRMQRLKVVCRIDDDQLNGLIAVMIICSLVGAFSNIQVLKVLSFVPIFYFIYSFYIKRNEYIQIKAV